METPPALAGLTQAEIDALRGAAVWYAKYHARVVADAADDDTAYAVEERREYLALVAALEKLGVRVGVPGELAAADRAAA